MQMAALDNLVITCAEQKREHHFTWYGTITDIYTETYLKLNDKVAERQQLRTRCRPFKS